MSRVLSAVAAVFFLGGLALTVGYVANQVVQWQLTRTLNLEHVQFFYLGGIAASIGMLTLALLEIRIAILTTLDHSDPFHQEPPSEGQTGDQKPAKKKSWKKNPDIHRSFLGTRDSR